MTKLVELLAAKRARLVYGQRRVQVLEAAQRRAAAAGHKLEQAALVLLRQRCVSANLSKRMIPSNTEQQLVMNSNKQQCVAQRL